MLIRKHPVQSPPASVGKTAKKRVTGVANTPSGLDSQQVVAIYSYYYKARYGSNPYMSPADRGQIKNIAKSSAIENQTDLRICMSSYLSMEDTFVRTNGHPLRLFLGSLSKIRAAIAAPSRRQTEFAADKHAQELE